MTARSPGATWKWFDITAMHGCMGCLALDLQRHLVAMQDCEGSKARTCNLAIFPSVRPVQLPYQ